jgi:hypothetical protein
VDAFNSTVTGTPQGETGMVRPRPTNLSGPMISPNRLYRRYPSYRASVFESDFSGFLSVGFVELLAAQKDFCLRRPPGNRRHTAEDDAGITNRAPTTLHDRCDAHNGVIPCEALPDFMVEAFAARFWIGGKDLGDGAEWETRFLA